MQVLPAIHFSYTRTNMFKLTCRYIGQFGQMCMNVGTLMFGIDLHNCSFFLVNIITRIKNTDYLIIIMAASIIGEPPTPTYPLWGGVE